MIKIVFFGFLSLTTAYIDNELLSISITRHHNGDIFNVQGDNCYKDFCISLSSGTAEATANGECECKCKKHLPIFRDDLNTCVNDLQGVSQGEETRRLARCNKNERLLCGDDSFATNQCTDPNVYLQECSLLPFSSGTTIKTVPYVFLPLKGQIVYPSAEIIISDVQAPVCVVSGGQFLGRHGWLNLRNNSGTEPPFRLLRDEGRTYLQWLGEPSMRIAMEGRIILVHLMCKDADSLEEPRIFTPCIAFRVAGNPSVREVMFATDVHLKEEYSGGLSLREYIAIGVCSLLLAIIYVASVLIYLHFRKRRRKETNQKHGDETHLTIGEEGIIKSNPLLQATRHFPGGGQDNAGYISDSNSCCSDADRSSDLLCLDEDDLVGHQNIQTSVIIHPCDFECGDGTHNQDSNNIEKLPEENVSIVETLEIKEDHPDTIKSMTSVNGRRKLYFNPSYFEPDLLKAPPPAALEFLTKIREVMALAKHKMSAKKFSPSLLGIPEEEGSLKTDYGTGLSRRKDAVVENTENCEPQKAIHSPANENRSTNCHVNANDFCCPSDSKQRIIRKWLEDVPIMIQKTCAEEYREKKFEQSVHCESICEKNKGLNGSKCRRGVNEYKLNSKAKEVEIPIPPVRPDSKRPSTKGRAPPIPPQPPLRSFDTKSGGESPESEECLSKTEPSNVSSSLQPGKVNGASRSNSLTERVAKREDVNSLFSETTPPRPPPLPLTNLAKEPVNFHHTKGKDCVQPVLAKSLMDAVIQELTGIRNNEKVLKSKTKRESEELQDGLQEKCKNGDMLETSNAGRLHSETDKPMNGTEPMRSEYEVNSANNSGQLAQTRVSEEGNVQDDHEYEVILLNTNLEPFTEEKSSELKIYNLPELLSKNDRNEGYSLVSEVYVNDGYSCCSSGESSPVCSTNSSLESDKISYEILNEKPGRLTIHVNDSPKQFKDYSGESDNFEPDTLDRKPRRSKLVQRINEGNEDLERYSNQRFHDMDCYKKSSNTENSENFTDSLERPSIMLKTNGSFKRSSLENDVNDLFRSLNWGQAENHENFGSLREIFEAKSRNHRRRTETTSLIDFVNSDTDCISTLSWNEERRNKLLHRGIILHIDEGSRRHRARTSPCRSRTEKTDNFNKAPPRPPKSISTSKSRSDSPISPRCISPSKSNRSFTASPLSIKSPASPRNITPPLPPPRSPLVSPPSDILQQRSANSSPISIDNSKIIRNRMNMTSPPRSPINNSTSRSSSRNYNTTPPRSLCPSPIPSSSHCVSPPPLSPNFSVPARPPKPRHDKSPPLPPRNTKPPLPPKNAKRTRQKPACSKFADRPLPPLPPPRSPNDCSSSPVPSKDLEMLATLFGASMDSLDSSEYEAFYTLPYEEEGNDGKNELDPQINAKKGTQSRNASSPYQNKAIFAKNSSSSNKAVGDQDDQRKVVNRFQNQTLRDAERRSWREINKAIPHRPDDSGYLSTDSSESFCPVQMSSSSHASRNPEKGEPPYISQNSETEESFCDGASESGGESIATDFFFFENYQKGTVRGTPSENKADVYSYSLRLSDVEVNSDTERHCVPIMVRP